MAFKLQRPTMTCPDCGADLDRVPVEEPCPGCGGKRRAAHVKLIVDTALAELAAMPADQARAVVNQATQLLERTGEHRVGQAEPLAGCATLGPAVGRRMDPSESAPTWKRLFTLGPKDAVDIRNQIIAAVLAHALAQRLLTQPVHEAKVNAHDQCEPPNRVELRDDRPAPEPPVLPLPTARL
jgi:hypothetical protein